MVLDAMKSEAANTTYAHKQILTRELEAVGLRLNQTPPRIYVKKKKSRRRSSFRYCTRGADENRSQSNHERFTRV